MKYRLFAPAVAVLIAAVIIGALIPVLFGAPSRVVHVTWRGLDTAERARLEHRFGLSEPKSIGQGTWAYVPLDSSRDTLRALVRLDTVAATDGINRTTFRISDDAPLTARRGGLLAGAPRLAAPVAKLIAYGLALLAALLLVRAGLLAAGVPFAAVNPAAMRDPRAMRNLLSAWLARGVPAVSPASVAVFRFVFGILVTAYVWSEPVYPALLSGYELGGATGIYGAVVRALAERPALVDALRFGVLASGVLFAVGLRPRVSFAALASFVVLWACVLTLRTTSHTVSAMLLTIVCLLPARWGDAWSLDALLRRVAARSPEPTYGPAKAYVGPNGTVAANITEGRNERSELTADVVSGFPVWVPVLVLGVTFAAAAWAKMQSGLDWILNGTVKYHFLSDAEYAWVDWGLRVSEWHPAAVLLSAGAVLVEALMITAAFSRSDRYRLAMGGAAATLLVGFALFQGVLWPGWWILLVGFLPWGRMARPATTTPPIRVPLRPLEMAAVLCVIGQQVYVSTRQVEARPFLTAYDMYSTTYGSPEDYEAATNLVYRVVGISADDASDLPGCIIDDAAARTVEAASRGDARAREQVKALIGPCVSDRPDVTMVRLEGDRQVYDWQQRRFHWRKRLDVVGPLRVDWLRE